MLAIVNNSVDSRERFLTRRDGARYYSQCYLQFSPTRTSTGKLPQAMVGGKIWVAVRPVGSDIRLIAELMPSQDLKTDHHYECRFSIDEIVRGHEPTLHIGAVVTLTHKGRP